MLQPALKNTAPGLYSESAKISQKNRLECPWKALKGITSTFEWLDW